MKTSARPKGTIVLFAPHPDDETLGCGGYLAKRTDEGYKVFVVVLTMGEKLFSHVLKIFEDPSPSDIQSIRKEETRKATAILGLSDDDLLFLEYEDGTLDTQKDVVVERIIPILEAKRPVEVLCTSAYEAHPDHRAASEIVHRACDRVAAGTPIRHYITSLKAGLSTDELPCTVETVDIGKYLPRKAKAVAQFRAHLDILSKQQTKPIAADFNAYLRPQERFIMMRP